MKHTPKLMFYTMTKKIVEDLDKLQMSYIGNNPKTFEDVMYKQHFKALVKKLGLPVLPTQTYLREAFLDASYEQLQSEIGSAFVVQRGDKETGGNEGTFFIHGRADFDRCRDILTEDKSFSTIVCARFVKGHSTSMLGCVMPKAEAEAQHVVEEIGEYLRTQGYKGIFGIDFLYDKETQEIFASECNPRFTGSLVLYSLMLLEAGVPPMEFFHLLAHLNIDAQIDFDAVNKALKTRLPCAHIAFSPRGITSMEIELPAGVYECQPGAEETLRYVRPGISLADVRNPGEFLLVDTVPALHGPIEQQVPRLFKFIFPRSIAQSSYKIDKSAGLLVSVFADALLSAAQKKKPPVKDRTEGMTTAGSVQ
jgi:biotin carboxylase